jgi:radical SAM protein with 4Fe4S-binding SPASM domain
MVRMDANEDALEKIKNLFEDIVDGISYLDFADFNNTFDDDYLRQECERFICPQPWQRLVVAWNGKTYPCCIDHYGSYFLGNLNDESLLSIWTGRKLNALREKFLSREWITVDMCKRCQKSRLITWAREDGTV